MVKVKQQDLKPEELLTIIFDYMAKITAENNIEKQLMNLADFGEKLVLADRCRVWLHKPAEKELWTVTAHRMEKIIMSETSGLVGHCVTTGEPVIVADAYHDNRFNKDIDTKKGYRTNSVICIPFRNTEGDILGVFQAINKITLEGQFTKQDEEALALAAFYAGVSLESSALRLELIETQREMIERIGEIGENRSQETGHHVKRVAEYSYLLATLAGIPEDKAMQLKIASPMHDIGKVAIPDNILLKPDKLTVEEFEVMKSHAEIGYQVFKHSNRALLKTAAIIANEHHERWDGTGYPNGLSGEDIHIKGRITAIADVFDALGTERVYKKAWPLDKIINYMRDQRGKQFDPTLIDLFLANIDQFIAIRDQY